MSQTNSLTGGAPSSATPQGVPSLGGGNSAGAPMSNQVDQTRSGGVPSLDGGAKPPQSPYRYDDGSGSRALMFNGTPDTLPYNGTTTLSVGRQQQADNDRAHQRWLAGPMPPLPPLAPTAQTATTPGAASGVMTPETGDAAATDTLQWSPGQTASDVAQPGGGSTQPQNQSLKSPAGSATGAGEDSTAITDLQNKS